MITARSEPTLGESILVGRAVYRVLTIADLHNRSRVALLASPSGRRTRAVLLADLVYAPWSAPRAEPPVSGIWRVP
jgi:hypothetical protein